MDNVSSESASFTADMAGTYTIQLIVNDGLLDSEPIDSEPKTVDITATSAPVDTTPTANAGTSQTVIISSQVTLNGSQSAANDGSDLNYVWTITSKPTDSRAELVQSTTATPTFIADLAGNYELSLTVTNGSANTASAVVMVTATDGTSNKPPIAEAGDSQSLPENQLGTINLDGSNSHDPEGVNLIYSWQFVKKPKDSQSVLTDATTATPSFEPDEAGTYIIGLTVNDGEVDSKLDTTGVTVYLPVDEVEPNDAADQAQTLTKLGLGYPIKASMPAGSDQDWYRFEAEKGETYVVEVFDVTTGLAKTQGRGCNGGAYTGLSITVLDSFKSEVITPQCLPSATGNVHNRLEYKAGFNDTYFIKIALNATTSADAGRYSLRVLPKHTNKTAAWDAKDFEPNDMATTAYAIDVGLDSAIISNFEARDSIYSTNQADVDWYRFEATAGQTYLVELFDVDMSLAVTKGWDCNGAGYFGLSLVIFLGNATMTEIKRQCPPVGGDNIHNIIEFEANKESTYYIQVTSNANTGTDNGNYSIRVVPK